MKLITLEKWAGVIALTIKRAGAALVTDAEAKELLPADWKALLGRWAHAALSQWQAAIHGIRVEYVSHARHASRQHRQHRQPGSVSLRPRMGGRPHHPLAPHQTALYSPGSIQGKDSPCQ